MQLCHDPELGSREVAMSPSCEFPRSPMEPCAFRPTGPEEEEDMDAAPEPPRRP